MAKKPKKKPKHLHEPPGPKFSKTEHEEKLVKCAELDRKGYDQYRIASLLNVSQPMVSGYLKKIRARYKEEQLVHREESVLIALASLREIRKELWEAWELSRKPEKKTHFETKDSPPSDSSPGGLTTTKKRIKTGRIPNDRYMALILASISQERELLGLDPPKKTMGQLDLKSEEGFWAKMFKPGMSADKVNEEIEKVLKESPNEHPSPENVFEPES